MKANKTSYSLTESAYFKDSLMLKVSGDKYGNYSMNKDYPLILVSRV